MQSTAAAKTTFTIRSQSAYIQHPTTDAAGKVHAGDFEGGGEGAVHAQLTRLEQIVEYLKVLYR